MQKLDTMDWLSMKVKNISTDMKFVFVMTMVLGFIIHMFAYTNLLLGHDAMQPAIILDDIFACANGGRWLNGLYFCLTRNLTIPWIIGIFSLVFYSISACLVIRILHLNKKYEMIYISILILTNIATISSHLYISSLHLYALALLTSVLAVYIMDLYPTKWYYAFVSLFISLGLYPAYISVVASLFLLVIIRDIYECKKNIRKIYFESGKKFLWFVGTLTGYYISLIMIMKSINLEFSGEREGTGKYTINQIPKLIYDVYYRVYDELFSQSDVTYYPLYIQNLWIIVMCIGIAIAIYMYIKKRLYINFLTTIAIAIAVMLLPFGMNAIGILNKSGFTHNLMQFAFQIPLYIAIMLFSIYRKEYIEGFSMKRGMLKMYNITSIIILSAIILIGYNGILIANEAYVQYKINYDADLVKMTRIADRIEMMPEYNKGDKIAVLPFTSKLYDVREGFEASSSLTGMGRAALTGVGAFQVLANDILRFDWNFVECTESQMEQMKECEAFPGEDSIMYIEDVVVIKLQNKN